MIKTVIKRDGTNAHFQIEKIFNVLDKAFGSIEMETPVEAYDFVKEWTNDYENESIDGGPLFIKDADDYSNQWIYYPEEINIVRIEGEMVLNK